MYTPAFELLDFVQSRMRVFHFYQPVMHLAMLQGGGRSSIREIDRSIVLQVE
jgi:hypothetical protein